MAYSHIKSWLSIFFRASCPVWSDIPVLAPHVTPVTIVSPIEIPDAVIRQGFYVAFHMIIFSYPRFGWDCYIAAITQIGINPETTISCDTSYDLF